MNTTAFFQTMYHDAPSGWLTIWTLPNKKTAYFPVTDIPAAVDYAVSRFDTHDVYFGVGFRREQLGENQRGGSKGVCIDYLT